MPGVSQIEQMQNELFSVDKNNIPSSEKVKLTTDGRKENLNVGARDQLWIHSIGHSEKRTTKMRFRGLKSTCDFWEIPNWFDGCLSTNRLTRRKQDFAIGPETTGSNSFSAFGQVDMGFCDCNGRTNVPIKSIK